MLQPIIKAVDMDIRGLLQTAVLAPSGDNCQPWRFETKENEVRVFNLPNRDTSVYNHNQIASYAAHGALLETLSIAAAQNGYAAEISYFPDTSNRDHVATVVFSATQAADQPQFGAIPLRTTNRKHYLKRKLESAHGEALRAVGVASELGRAMIFEAGPAHAALAHAAQLNDRIVFENQWLHAFLFEHIRWSDEEARKTRDGMDVKTLELAAPDRVAFTLLLRHWSAVRLMNFLGVSRMIAKQTYKQVLSASALGLITMPGNRPADYVRGGRLIQRVWLEATRHGLSFHLMAGSALLMQQTHEGSGHKISERHLAELKSADRQVREACGIGESEVLLAVFRTGYCSPPTARALRMDPVVE